MTKVLITGANGYLGSRLVERLSKTKTVFPLVRESKRDFNKKDVVFKEFSDLEKIILKIQPDTVIHTACCYGRSGEPIENVYTANLTFGAELIRCLSNCEKLTSFVNIGTTLNPKINTYAHTKNLFSMLLQNVKTTNISKIDLKLEHFYGPGDHENKFPTMLIRKMLAGVESIDLSSCNNKRNFISVYDVETAIETVINNSIRKSEAGYYQHVIKSEEEIELKKFVQIVKKLCGSKTKLNFGALPDRVLESDPRGTYEHIKIVENWEPHIPLIDGLKAMIEEEKNVKYGK